MNLTVKIQSGNKKQLLTALEEVLFMVKRECSDKVCKGCKQKNCIISGGGSEKDLEYDWKLKRGRKT